MKILTVCSQGNNRSVHLGHPLKYWNHDVIPIGVDNTSVETLEMLFKWADVIITTEENQFIPDKFTPKRVLFDVGPDTYKRPFNVELHMKVKEWLRENKSWLKGENNDS
jgi:galactitol-specific phosphotransferase system IIB component